MDVRIARLDTPCESPLASCVDSTASHRHPREYRATVGTPEATADFPERSAHALLAEIGMQLDSGGYPAVYDGGFVGPCKPPVKSQPQGQEKENGESGSREGQPAWQRSRPWSAPQPWSRPRSRVARWTRTAARSRTCTEAASDVDADLRRQYEAELDDVCFAYPGAKVWQYGNGMWLRTESSLLRGLTKRATFLTAIPFVAGHRAIGWGCWTTPVSASWIGPRHTNFPDGSVCAFEPSDGTWSIGDRIVELLDLYTLWALRHLYLEVFSRWPGYQAVPIPYERIQELREGEFCGCERSDRRYEECCKRADSALDQLQALMQFVSLTGGIRKPPKWLFSSAFGLQAPPEIPLIKEHIV